jgi:SAM-dependent methyltransferase
MDERSAEQTRASYDRVAAEYTARIADELQGKPLDRALLRCLAERAGARGLICDLGCGPGQVAAFLAECGAQVCGVDLSPGMVEQAQRRFPHIPFHTGDMCALGWPDGAFAGVAAFYSIIHVPPARLPRAFGELRRVLAPGGLALLAFHIGDETVHLDDWWEQPVALDFHFLQPEPVAALLEQAGLAVESITTRAPDPQVEHPSRRAYIFARRTTNDE